MKISQKLDRAETYIPEQANCDIYLNANESFVVPDEVLEKAIKDAIEEASQNLNRYPDAFSVGLCQAFADYYGIDWRLVSAANGSDESILMLYACLLDAGDKVLTLDRDFSMYRITGNTQNQQIIALKKDEDSQSVAIETIVKTAKEEDVSMIIFSNPCNPTGQIFAREEIITLVESFDGVVVVDEAYMDFADESVIDLAGGKYENLVVLRTASKAFALAGVRIGMQVASLDITRRLQAGKLVFNVSIFGQKIGEAIYRHKASYQKAIAEIKESTAFLYEHLVQLSQKYPRLKKIYQTHANFIFMRAENASGIFQSLKAKGVMTRDFGVDYFRVCAGTREENLAFLRALEAVLQEERA
mgnify:FL=1|jgi:histidinol-phosphate transaminase